MTPRVKGYRTAHSISHKHQVHSMRLKASLLVMLSQSPEKNENTEGLTTQYMKCMCTRLLYLIPLRYSQLFKS